MKKYIVIESANYADEFDIEGFKIMEAESVEEIENTLLGDTVFPCELYFGTNECQEYENKEDFLDAVSITEIPEEDIKILEKYFGNLTYAFGTTSIL